ncbi:MAG: nitroreductase [Flavobacteriales bacterium]|jgi:nitroreductase|nr:nitroreductase [Flavobacteriales bacterium]MBK9289025.1 nitroreductase [Flavobacteriales bacterium]
MRFSVSELTDIIRDRRTIYPKDYTDRAVHRDIIEKVLGNGTWAPNHGMTQPWRFHVFTGDARKRLSDFMGAEYTRLTPPEKFMPRKFENATLRPLQSSVVVALGLARDPNRKISELEEQLALACAVQNMHLTCTAYGLGGFWGTGAVVTGDGMRRFLGLGEEDRCMGLFYMGYPAIEWPKGYRKPLPDVTAWHEE